MTQLKKYVGTYLEKVMLFNARSYQAMGLIERRCLMMKKGKLNKLKGQIEKAIRKKEYRKLSFMLEKYKSNGGIL
jgi:hypothetical protein